MDKKSEYQSGLPEAVSKEHLLEVFKVFSQHGIANPDDLSLDDPAVIEANRKFGIWMADCLSRAEESYNPKKAEMELSLEYSMFYIDAGFTDPEYLEEVAYGRLGGSDLP